MKREGAARASPPQAAELGGEGVGGGLAFLARKASEPAVGLQVVAELVGDVERDELGFGRRPAWARAEDGRETR